MKKRSQKDTNFASVFLLQLRIHMISNCHKYKKAKEHDDIPNH